MSCILRAGGISFSVDQFLNESKLIPCAVFRKGEPINPASQPKGKTHKGSAINIPVSDADFNDLNEQIQDAIFFLKKNKEELEKLCDYPGVESVTLDFGIRRRDIYVQSDYFPPELLLLAGSLKIGIELSQYPISGDEEDRSTENRT